MQLTGQVNFANSVTGSAFQGCGTINTIGLITHVALYTLHKLFFQLFIYFTQNTNHNAFVDKQCGATFCSLGMPIFSALAFFFFLVKLKFIFNFTELIHLEFCSIFSPVSENSEVVLDPLSQASVELQVLEVKLSYEFEKIYAFVNQLWVFCFIWNSVRQHGLET